MYDLKWLRSEIEAGTKLKFIYFWGHQSNDTIGKECLSQWYPSPFTVNEVSFATAEHWMMAQKALLFNDLIIYDKVINCTKPGEAKDLGRQVKGYDEDTWLSHRMDIVIKGNAYKFSQDERLKAFLLNTGERVLVETSPIDQIWGVGLSADDPSIENIAQWPGTNLLGFALMEVRDFLKCEL